MVHCAICGKVLDELPSGGPAGIPRMHVSKDEFTGRDEFLGQDMICLSCAFKPPSPERIAEINREITLKNLQTQEEARRDLVGLTFINLSLNKELGFKPFLDIVQREAGYLKKERAQRYVDKFVNDVREPILAIANALADRMNSQPPTDFDKDQFLQEFAEYIKTTIPRNLIDERGSFSKFINRVARHPIISLFIIANLLGCVILWFTEKTPLFLVISVCFWVVFFPTLYDLFLNIEFKIRQSRFDKNRFNIHP